MSKTPITSRTSHSKEEFDLAGDIVRRDTKRRKSMADKTSSIYNPGVAVYDKERNANNLWLELKQLNKNNTDLDRQKEIYDELRKLGELDKYSHPKAGGRTKRRTFKGKKPKSKRASGSSLKKRKTKRKQRK